ncbi:MAG: M28 family metallopeptidase [Saprospiraceae bacterium]
MHRLSILLLAFLFSCSNIGTTGLILDELPTDQTVFQQMVIAQLSGERSIKTDENKEVLIKNRWTAKEKQRSRAYLKKLIEAFGLVPQIHDYTLPNSNPALDVLLEPLSGKNLYATLPSTAQSNEYVILGAHYDTRGKNIPGAIDNGSGIALILSIIRRATKMDVRDKNLMVVFFDQEEEGVSAGSISFANYLNSTDFEIHSVHSFDMIGWDSDNNKEVEIELPSAAIEAFYGKHAALLNIPIYTTSTNSSDHYSFIKAGINAVGVSQAYGKGDNSGKKDTPDDKYHLVNFEYLGTATDLAFEVIKDLLHD